MKGNVLQHLAVATATDIVRARSVARQEAARIGFGLADQTRLATAVSELARNVLKYASEGSCLIHEDSTATEMRLHITMEDHGPGIPDVAAAMKDGYSTGGGMGAGLPGTRRLVDKFEIESFPGLTRVTISMVRKRQ